MKSLNEISIETADELQEGTKKPYPKDSFITDSDGNITGVKTVEELEKRAGFILYKQLSKRGWVEDKTKPEEKK